MTVVGLKMTTTFSFKLYSTVVLQQTKDIVLARRQSRELAMHLGFGNADQTRLATAVSELARNVIAYAVHGECHIADASDTDFRRVTVVVEDQGPGIADIELALQDGYSSGGSLGAGLPGTRRLVTSFAIESRPGLTRVSISLAARKDGR